MIKKTIKLLFILIFLINFVFFLRMNIVLAQVDTSTSFTISYPPFAEAENIADLVIKLYNYALGISGTLAVIMIVYGGLKYLSSPGNPSALTDAKDIIYNAVFGIVILTGAFLVLNTINPSLTKLKIRPGNITPLAPVASSTSVLPGNGDILLQTYAAQLSFHANITDVGDCGNGNANASANLRDVAQGNLPMVCSHGCSNIRPNGCSPGGGSNITLDQTMLNALVMLYSENQQSGSFIINSLASGDHRNGSYHYAGKAVDLDSSSKVLAAWNSVVNYLKDRGATRAFCEAYIDTNSNGKYDAGEQNGQIDCEAMLLNPKARNTHIHAQW